MGGISLVLNAAKDALMTQQYAIDVTSHNVANVNTPGYSRQTPILSSKLPAPYAGFILGRGVELDQVVRNTDSFIETRLRERSGTLSAMTEEEVYLKALEGVFNESSGRSLSTQFENFWNAWHDLSNNPSGNAERNALYEMGALLAQSFNDLSEDMDQFTREIKLSMEAGVDKVNQITAEIASLNEQIVSMEVSGQANDLRDQRNALLNELSGYIDIKAFENDDGNMMAMTTSGYTLVDKSATYQLSIEGNDIKWEGSGDVEVTITDKISGGKLGGWLNIRDEILPKYEADLSALAKATIWEVNKIHSEGVGLDVFQTGQSLTGSYTTTTNLSALSFGGEIDFLGGFNLWIGDANGENLQQVAVDLTYVNGGIGPITGASSLADLAASINDQITTGAGLTGVTVSVSGDALVLTADGTHTFALSGDTSDILSALGVNNFFEGSNALTMEMNSFLESNKEFIAAGVIDPATGTYAAGDNTNALAMANLQYGNVTIERWTYERGQTPTSQDVSDTLENYLHSLVGSIGIESQSVSRAKDYNQVVIDQLNATRDSISAVSLDEEMTNLIKYQQGYTAAAKLISTADEMFQTLLETR